MCTCTPSAPRTAASPSVGGGCPTVSAPASSPTDGYHQRRWPSCGPACAGCCLRPATSVWPPVGAASSGSAATGARPSGWPAPVPAGWRGPAGTSAMASPRPISPAAPGRPRPRSRHVARRAALGGPYLPQVGTGATALGGGAGRLRHVPGRRPGRRAPAGWGGRVGVVGPGGRQGQRPGIVEAAGASAIAPKRPPDWTGR